MAEIKSFPVEKVYSRSVKGREIWDQVEPPQEMVYGIAAEVCWVVFAMQARIES